jgi:hypothetical protein
VLAPELARHGPGLVRVAAVARPQHRGLGTTSRCNEAPFGAPYVAELCLTSVVASELFSLDLSKTEVLTREAADISGRRPVGGWRWQEAGAVVSGVVPL